jgi:hypothetical protein
VALGDEAGGGGIPANEATGQPELLAANHEACGYAWAIPAGLQLRAEARLLQVAQELGSDTFVPAKLKELITGNATSAINEAKQLLQESLDFWQPLHDPEPEREDQNFKLNGKEYNYRAVETYGVLTDLEGGLLTRCPLEPVEVPTEETEPDQDSDMTRRFHVALSFPGEHRAFVNDIADALAKKLTKGKVFYDKWYEAELARPNLDTYLQKIYGKESDLVVIFLCEAYEQKEWCHLEARAIRELIKQRRDDEVMFVRVDDGDVSGVFSGDGYIDANEREAAEVASLIRGRLKLIQAKDE